MDKETRELLGAASEVLRDRQKTTADRYIVSGAVMRKLAAIVYNPGYFVQPTEAPPPAQEAQAVVRWWIRTPMQWHALTDGVKSNGQVALGVMTLCGRWKSVNDYTDVTEGPKPPTEGPICQTCLEKAQEAQEAQAQEKGD